MCVLCVWGVSESALVCCLGGVEMRCQITLALAGLFPPVIPSWVHRIQALHHRPSPTPHYHPHHTTNHSDATTCMRGRCCLLSLLVLFGVCLAVTQSFFVPAPASPARQHSSTMASSSTPTPNSINATPPSASQALEFLRVVGKLKTLKRTGWVNNGVTLPESVADHMYRMAMCSFLITDPALDRARLIKLAVVHDLAEALVGDIVPHDVRFTKEQKRVLEEEAIKSITRDLGHEGIGAEIVSLWLEYEDQSTPEARVVKDFDKFEMIVQADEYERAQPTQDLTDFFQSTQGAFQHPQVVAWDEELRRQRDAKSRKDEKEG